MRLIFIDKIFKVFISPGAKNNAGPFLRFPGFWTVLCLKPDDYGRIPLISRLLMSAARSTGRSLFAHKIYLQNKFF
jgi:hypothetical protein